MRPRKVSRSWSSRCTHPAPRRAPAPVSKTISVSPAGITGQDLAARAFTQANKFGARFALARSGVGLARGEATYSVALDGGGSVQARSVIVACGVRYRPAGIPGVEPFEGTCVHHAATNIKAQLCSGEEVEIVGGGNSAGQAAVYLARVVHHVHILVRGPSLAESMSRYLIRVLEELRTSTSSS